MDLFKPRRRENQNMTARHFPTLWTAEVQPNYYVVRDANGQQIGYVLL